LLFNSWGLLNCSAGDTLRGIVVRRNFTETQKSVHGPKIKIGVLERLWYKRTKPRQLKYGKFNDLFNILFSLTLRRGWKKKQNEHHTQNTFPKSI